MTDSTDLARAFHAASSGSDPMSNVQGCELVEVASLMIVIGSKKEQESRQRDVFRVTRAQRSAWSQLSELYAQSREGFPKEDLVGPERLDAAQICACNLGVESCEWLGIGRWSSGM